MRRYICVIMTVVIALGFTNISKAVVTTGTIYKDFEYRVLEDDSGEIVGYYGSDYEIDIPETINGVYITSIGYCAFQNKKGVRKINFPSSVKKIEGYAFYNCSDLEEISLQDGLETIMCGAFNACSSLINVTLPASLKMVECPVFSDCSSLQKIVISADNDRYGVYKDFLFDKKEKCIIDCARGAIKSTLIIPDGTRSIGSDVFSGCETVKEIYLPDSLRIIERGAFDRCAGLQKVNLPNTLEVIDDYAFEYCEQLKEINLPKALKTIGENPFCGCKELSKIEIPEDHPIFQMINGLLCNKENKEVVCCLPGSQQTIYVIPEGIKRIGDCAFEGCSLISVDFVDEVAEIGANAFWECTNLQSITNLKALTKIEYGAFGNCESLREVELPESVKEIEGSVFDGCYY